ncbi:MAG: ParB N-terminal domain-containing protein [bacterium]|nr:ParB N-terminal domain-containing protein [bacterium]
MTGKKFIETVSLETIDLQNRDFKISRKHIDEKLERSIQNFGILEPILLLKEKNREKYRVIFGFNRLDTLAKTGNTTVPAIIPENMEPGLYMRYLSVKSYRNEIGPAGKIKAVSILKEMLKASQESHAIQKSQFRKLCKTGLNLPDEFIENESLIDSFNSLPPVLPDYFDSKDINFRAIKDTLKLPAEALMQLTQWLEWIDPAGLRVNIFKGIIDLMTDIYRRDKNKTSIQISIPAEHNNFTDRRKKEEYIYRELFKIRYPEYSAQKEKIDSIINEFASHGIAIKYPEYFEGETIDITLSVNKKEKSQQLKNKLEYIDNNKISLLLEML